LYIYRSELLKRESAFRAFFGKLTVVASIGQSTVEKQQQQQQQQLWIGAAWAAILARKLHRAASVFV